MNQESDQIEAPKQWGNKQPVIVEPVAFQPQMIDVPKVKRTLSDKQKETLAKGRANLKIKKEQQLKETQYYKDEMVLLRAEQLKQHKKTLKKQVGYSGRELESDSETDIRAIESVVCKAKKPRKKKVVYVESDSESEEEQIVYKKATKKKVPVPPTPVPTAPPTGKITFY